MKITFYFAPMSSASPVDSALRELEVPHEKVTFDLKETEHKKPEYLKLNPNGRVPTIVVDGAPMFEAVAIMQWLGEKFGVARGQWPAADTPERLRALSWTTWSYVQFGGALRVWNSVQGQFTQAAFRNAALAEHANKELQDLLGILDGELTRPYLLGDKFSLADLIVASVVGFGVHCGVSTEKHRRVTDWLARCNDRPSMRAAYE